MRAQTFIHEIAIDQRVPSFPGVYGAIAFAAKKGKVNAGVLATTDTEFLKQTTPDETIRIGYANGYYSARAFLLKSNKLWISRAAAEPIYGGALSYQDLIYPSFQVTANHVINALALFSSSIKETEKATDLFNQLSIGDSFTLSASEGGTLPEGLVEGKTYYVIPFDKNSRTFQIAENTVDAENEVAIELTTSGVGIFTMTFSETQPNAGLNVGWKEPTNYMLDTSDGRPARFTSLLSMTLTNSELKVSKELYNTVNTGERVKLTAVTFPEASAGDPLDSETEYFAIKKGKNKIQIARTLEEAGLSSNIEFSTLGDTLNVALQGRSVEGVVTFENNNVSIPATFYNTVLTNDVVTFTSEGTLPSGLVAGTEYIAVKGAVNTITVTETRGGDVVELGDAGTGTHAIALKGKAVSSSATGDLSDDLFGVNEQFRDLCQDGDPVTLTTDGTLPTGLSTGTTYYIIKAGTKIALARTEAAQKLYEALDVTDAGEGLHTVHLEANTPKYGFDMPAVMFYGSNPGDWNRNIYYTTEHYPYGDKEDWTKEQSEIADKVKYPNCFQLKIFKRDLDDNYELKETHICSRTEGHLDGFGTNIYVEDKLQTSHYMRAMNNPAVPANILPKDQTALLMLTGSSDGGTVTDTEMMRAFEVFRSTRNHQVTLLLDGGWATPAFAKQSMISIAESRKDCFAILSCPLENEMDSDPLNAVIGYRKDTLNANTSYAALYSPHLVIRDPFNARDLVVSADGYIGANISEQSAVSQFWLPPAGEKRGQLNVVDTVYHWSEGDMDTLYNVQVNPIDFYPGRGIFVAGQKTLLAIPSALDRINCRLVLIVVEPALKRFLDGFLMEYNDKSTRRACYTGIESAMKKYKAQGAFYDFTIICDDSNNPGEIIDANEMWAEVYCQLTKAAEFIHLNVVITPTNYVVSAIG